MAGPHLQTDACWRLSDSGLDLWMLEYHESGIYVSVGDSRSMR